MGEELRKKLAEEVKEEATKIKAEKVEVQSQLHGSQEDIQTVQHSYATMSGKVMGLEKEVKVAEERLCEDADCKVASREATGLDAKQLAINEFKHSEEYKASQDYDAGYDNGYDKGVEEIIYNIWRKRREVNYKFLGKEYQQLIIDWEDQEKQGELDTWPPPFLVYSDDDCEIVRQELADEANDNAPAT